MNETATPTKKFAVVQTGGTTGDGEIVIFKDEAGTKRPAVLFTHEDATVCNRRKKRLLSYYNKIAKFADDKFAILSPILGVVEIAMEASAKRGPRKPKESTNGHATPHQQAAAAANRAQGQPATTGKK